MAKAKASKPATAPDPREQSPTYSTTVKTYLGLKPNASNDDVDHRLRALSEPVYGTMKVRPTEVERARQRLRDEESIADLCAVPAAKPEPTPKPARTEGRPVAAAPGAENAAPRAKLSVLGHPLTAVIRWLGANGYDREGAKAALKRAGVDEVNDSTLGVQLNKGKKGVEAPAPLTADQIKTLTRGKK